MKKTISLATAVLMVLHASGLAAQDAARADADAIAYINAHADKDDMVMMPMRDGVHLYGLVLFPKGQPRKNLPTVLIRTPYLIVADQLTFPRYVRSFLDH